MEEVSLPGTRLQPQFLGSEHVQSAPQVFTWLQDLPAFRTSREVPAKEEVLGLRFLCRASSVEGTPCGTRRQAFRSGKDEA